MTKNRSESVKIRFFVAVSKRACPNKVVARMWFMHAPLGRAILFLDIMTEFTLLSMRVIATPCLWYVVGMKSVMSYLKSPQAPFARASFGERRLKSPSEAGFLRAELKGTN